MKQDYAVALGDSYLVSLTSGQLVQMSQLMSESMLIYNYLERTKMERGGTARVAPRAFDRAKDMTHSQDETGQRYPYDRLAESGDYDEALDELWASRRDGEPHIPTFAKAMLERLSDVVFLHRTDAQTPVNVRTAKIGEEQEVWIRVDTHRDEV